MCCNEQTIGAAECLLPPRQLSVSRAKSALPTSCKGQGQGPDKSETALAGKTERPPIPPRRLHPSSNATDACRSPVGALHARARASPPVAHDMSTVMSSRAPPPCVLASSRVLHASHTGTRRGTSPFWKEFNAAVVVHARRCTTSCRDLAMNLTSTKARKPSLHRTDPRYEHPSCCPYWPSMEWHMLHVFFRNMLHTYLSTYNASVRRELYRAVGLLNYNIP